MSFNGFELEIASLQRAFNGRTLCFSIHPDTDTDIPTEMDDVREAARSLNESFREQGSRAHGEGWLQLGGGSFAGVIKYLASWDEALEWLEGLTHLFLPGGKIKGGPRSGGAFGPRPYVESFQRSQPLVRCAYTVADYDRNLRWGPDTRTTKKIATATSNWLVTPRATTYFSYETRAAVADLDLTEAILEAIDRGNQVVLDTERTQTARRTYVRRQLSFDFPNIVSFLWWEEDLPWKDKKTDLMRLLLLSPGRLDYGYIGLGNSAIFSTGIDKPWWPHVGEQHMRRTKRAALSSLVPDVHGIQVLTSAHLERAHDLSAWTVEEVANDRFLVTHPDVDQWFAHAVPPDDLLESARDDFGEMVMTPERIDAIVRPKP